MKTDNPSPIYFSGHSLATIGTGKRVLVIEGDFFTRLVLSSLLRQRGYAVDAFSGITAARTYSTSTRYELVIVNLRLLSGDGGLLLTEMITRSNSRRIFLCDSDSDGALASSREAGFVAHLAKPVQSLALDAALTQALRGR